MNQTALDRAKKAFDKITTDKRGFAIVVLGHEGDFEVTTEGSFSDVFYMGARLTQLATSLSPLDLEKGKENVQKESDSPRREDADKRNGV